MSLTVISTFSFVVYYQNRGHADLFGPNYQLVSQYAQLN